MLTQSINETLHNLSDVLTSLAAILGEYGEEPYRRHSGITELPMAAIERAHSVALLLKRQILAAGEALPHTLHTSPRRITNIAIRLDELISVLSRLANNIKELSPLQDEKSELPSLSLLTLEMSAKYFSVELAYFSKFEKQVAASKPLSTEPTPTSSSKNPWHEFVPVYFATDRKYAEDSEAQLCKFLNKRGSELTYGIAEVSIPPHHKPGNLERPFSFWKIQFKENPDKHIVITDCSRLPLNDWKNRATGTLQEMDSKLALVFIHGFNVSFDDAIRQAAQIGCDLELRGLITTYSWSSKAGVLDYVADEDSVRLTIPKFIEFIDTLKSIGITTIHIIAHSMGNRVLLEALEKISAPSSLGEVVMAAPDVDADLFKTAITSLQGKARRYTLYGSASDRAIQFSKKAHANYPRAGDGGKDILVINGVETIDATKVGEELFGFGLGHSYFSNKNLVLYDLYYLIRNSIPASGRKGLQESQLNGLPYWIFD